jgi:1-acyl-sn-glycerol-3-phosphate acyltransferase
MRNWESTGALDRLTALNTDDMIEAAGLAGLRYGRRLIERLCHRGARRFAADVMEFDETVRRAGLRKAAEWILRRNVRRIEVCGDAEIPIEGPLLIVANHPGLTDAVALLSVLRRDDVKVAVADRPFLRALGGTSKYLIYLSAEERSRMMNLRRMACHLRHGGAVLLFPRGEIEPDPALSVEAVNEIARWSRSIGALVRLAGEAVVVPVMVSGVQSPSAHAHPLTLFRNRPEDRDRLAAMLQVLMPGLRDVTVRVTFGAPIPYSALTENGDATAAITDIVRARARALIAFEQLRWAPSRV